MFKLEIKIDEDTLSRLEGIATMLAGGTAAPAKKKTAAKKTAKADEDEEPDEDTDDFEAEEEKPKNTTKAITLDMIRAKVAEKKEEDKSKGIRACLDAFDAEGITKLEKKDYAAFYKKLSAL